MIDHHNQTDKLESAEKSARNARIGMRLFVVYLLFYAGFVLINTFFPSWMESTPLAGVNLAIYYGFALIISAFVLAIIYGWLCRETRS